ncbi:SMI1/KNR4 family protein [Zavarzinella formosa]|uniref:SMI1/KNR4 family protein n=1 Tax=Zavarzinella formosa TaxID=360055 RepID=UPI000495FDE6|nr:SMI1/KNR4 family protein [Zavarzinella formosa]
MTKDPFASILKRMQRSGVAEPSGLLGCTPAQIQRLETRYGVTLPATYRRFLELMGRKSGRLVTHDHLDIQYDYVVKATAGFPKLLDESSSFTLPADALIILGRDGDQFHYIRCDHPEDSAVWYVNLDDLKPRQVRKSVVGWVRSWCQEAEQAIADGYY